MLVAGVIGLVICNYELGVMSDELRIKIPNS